MNIIQSIQKQMVPIHREGYIFILGFAVATLVLFWLWEPLGWVGLVLTIWCAYFFRDPERVVPLGADLIVSPADGVVCSVGEFVPPPELELGSAKMLRISVFMSVFDCHVNRMPAAGRIARIAYTPGLFVNADLDKASEDNERNGVVIETAAGKIGVVQIAGLIARRIVCFTREGASLDTGERFGLIRFGSRVDVYLPTSAVPQVDLESRAIAGETVLARLSGTPMKFRRI